LKRILLNHYSLICVFGCLVRHINCAMRTLAKVLLYDVVVALVHIMLDGYLIYSYFHSGDNWWAGATITAVCLPGLLELLTYTYSLLHGDLQGPLSTQLAEYVFWAICFGPVLYPVSLVVWHAYMVCKGEEHFLKYENIARSRVLTSLSVLTKSALQLTLQTTIVMITWNKDNIAYHVYQMASACFSIIALAKSCTDHHYFESSGKNISVHIPYGKTLKRLLFNFLHILMRGFILALLGGYLQFFSLLFIFLMIIVNYITANIFIKTDGSKHIWTAFAAVLLPTCFASRETFKNKDPSYGKKIFAKFYRYNSVFFFFIFGVAALVTTNLIIRYTSITTFSCANYPFLSYDQDLHCPSLSSFSNPIFDLPPPHSWFYFLGNLMVITMALLNVVLAFMEEVWIHDFSLVAPV